MSTTANDNDELGDLMSALGTDKVDVPDGITVEEVQQFQKLDKAIKKAKPRWEELSKKIKSAYKKTGTFAVLNIIIKRTKAEKVDWKKFEEHHPQSEFPDLYKKVWVLQQDVAKEHFDLKPFTDTIERVSIDTLDN